MSGISDKDIKKLIDFLNDKFNDSQIRWSIDEEIIKMKDAKIIVLSTDTLHKPYLYNDSPLEDECVSALKLVKILKSILITKETNGDAKNG